MVAALTRLWREVMLFEDISDAALLGSLGPYNDDRQNPHTNKKITSVGMCLSRCMFIQIPNSKLTTLATTDPAIALMLARIATKRHTLTVRCAGVVSVGGVSDGMSGQGVFAGGGVLSVGSH
ncbi:hypothetical protein ACFYWX_39920 [Streptomyces sp. NPDC002888]|uniref:hypothetical protein n=1 Tax=Streptomyces sp. NPDC002888 TaxID=3364668 RepID=UPI0036C3B42D